MLLRVRARLRDPGPAQSDFAVRDALAGKLVDDPLDEVRQNGFCRVTGKRLCSGQPEAHLRVVAVELVSDHFERSPVELEAYIGKRETGSPGQQGMFAVASTEDRPPVGRDPFCEVNRRHHEVIVLLVCLRIVEDTGVLVANENSQTTQRRTFLGTGVRCTIEPLNGKSHGALHRRLAKPL